MRSERAARASAPRRARHRPLQAHQRPPRPCPTGDHARGSPARWRDPRRPTLARWGGEEFMLMLPAPAHRRARLGARAALHARRGLARRQRRALELAFTVSAGLVEVRRTRRWWKDRAPTAPRSTRPSSRGRNKVVADARSPELVEGPAQPAGFDRLSLNGIPRPARTGVHRGHSTHIRSGCFVRPACASALAPQPQK